MKNINYVINGVLAVAVVILFIMQFSDKKESTVTKTFASGEGDTTNLLPIAYVNVDSLLLNYNYFKDLNEQLLKKEENSRANVTQQARNLQNEVQEFYRKAENNAFLTRERAQQEQERLMKKEQELKDLDAKLSQDLLMERQKLNAQRSFISLTYLGESARVLGNRDQLDELCQNLCDNAIRYNRPGGTVTLQCGTNDEGHPFLAVADTGIGIPEKHHKRVFERFYRVDKSRSKQTGGTGLGLAIVKHITERHGARIELSSRTGVGTEITVRFKKE